MKDKYAIFRFTAYVLELFILFVLQQMPVRFFVIAGCKPNLALAAFIIIILFENALTSLWFGLFLGVLSDVSMGEVIGPKAIIFCILAYIAGYISQNFLQKNILTALIVATFFIAVLYHLEFLMFYIIKGYSHIQYVYLQHFVPAMLYTWLCVPILYFPNKLFTLRVKEENESLEYQA